MCYRIHTISSFSGSNFCEIPVVVAFHLEVEYFTLGITSLGDQVLIKESLEHDDIINFYMFFFINFCHYVAQQRENKNRNIYKY